MRLVFCTLQLVFLFQLFLSQQQSNIILSNFFNGTHQIIVYQNLAVKVVQLISPPNNVILRPQSYVFTNGTHMLKISEDGRTTVTLLLQNPVTLTNSPLQTQTQQQQQTQQQTESKPVIFSVTNGTHLITVYQDLTLKATPLFSNQNQNMPLTSDTSSQMIFCNGMYELGLYGDGRIVKAPLFSLWRPPFQQPFFFQKYVISGFFNGTHNVTVYNDGRMTAVPFYYFLPPVIPYYYTSSLLRSQINNGTHDMKIYNNGRVAFFRLV
jgi:hypothetical protein